MDVEKGTPLEKLAAAMNLKNKGGSTGTSSAGLLTANHIMLCFMLSFMLCFILCMMNIVIGGGTFVLMTSLSSHMGVIKCYSRC